MKTVATVDLPDGSIDRLRSAHPGFEVLQLPGSQTIEVAPGELDEVEVAYSDHAFDWLADLPKLRWVQLRTAGIDHLVDSHLWRRGDVVLTTGSGIVAGPMAAFVIGLILHHAHRLEEALAIKANRAWPAQIESVRATTVTDQTIGLVGYGNVGRRIAEIAVALGMHVRAVSRTGSDSSTDRFEPVPRRFLDPALNGVIHEDLSGLDDLLGASDYVVVNVPFTPQSVDLIDREQFARMKPTAVLINVGRGGTVNESALDDALRSGRLAAAVLDVMGKEPLPPDSPLFDTPRLLLTPHAAGYFDRFAEFAVGLYCENLRRFRDGRSLLNVVDRGRGY